MDSPSTGQNHETSRAFARAAEKPILQPARDFEAAAGAPAPERKPPDEPHFRYRPPELVPGGMDDHGPELIDDVVREELDPHARRAIRETHDRSAMGLNDRDEYVPTEADLAEQFRWARDHDDGRWLMQEPGDADDFDRRVLSRPKGPDRHRDLDR